MERYFDSWMKEQYQKYIDSDFEGTFEEYIKMIKVENYESKPTSTGDDDELPY